MEKDREEVANIVNEAMASTQTCTEEREAGISSEGKKCRAKHKCPFPDCKSFVVHLPRHMRQKHKWSEKDSKGVLNVFALRKKRKLSGKRKRTFKQYMCPVVNCSSVVRRIHNHLTDVHKYERGGKTYRKMLAKATPHVVQVISSDFSTDDTGSTTENSDDSWYKKEMKKVGKKRKKSQEHPSIFKEVYSSEDEAQEDGGNSLKYPYVFRQELCHDSSDDEPTLPANNTLDEDFHEDKQHENSSMESLSEDTDDDYDCDIDNDILDNGPLEHAVQTHVFEKFENWLQGADGGRKDERCAKQCSRQVQLVVQAIDAETPKLSNILHKSTLRDKWLNDFEKTKQPGTVKSYLGALNQFYFFLKSEDLPDVDCNPEMLTSLSEQMKLWSKSYRKLIKDRFWEKRMEDIAKLKTPQQVQDFDSSDIARKVVKLLGDFQESSPEKVPTQSEYILVRDYLLTVVCINNGSRSGALANMTLGEFKQAQKDEEDFVIKVRVQCFYTLS